MSRRTQSQYSFFWILPALYGVSASAVVFFFPCLSNMKWWGFKLFLIKSIGYCCLFHLGISLWFLVRRAWRRCIGASLLVLLLFFSTLMAALVSGPDIKTVRSKVADVTGIRTSNLVCIGGRLSRESKVVFEVKDGVSPKIIGEEVKCQDDTVWEIILDTLSFVHASVPANARIEIRRFPEEFNTVFMVYIDGKSYAIFFGQSVM